MHLSFHIIPEYRTNWAWRSQGLLRVLSRNWRSGEEAQQACPLKQVGLN